MAEEADAAPVAASYAVHAAAAIEDGVQNVDTLAPAATEISTDPAASIAEHAVAITDPADAADESDNAGKTLAQPKTLSAMVDDLADNGLDAEMECLAGAVYFESKGEPLEGQLAVAEVIINRMKSGRFASTLCGVVKQRGQFSFVRGGKFPPIARGSAHWKKAVGIAHVAMQDLADSKVDDALFFHARRVSPGWKLKRLATVGNHVFYR
ncbi:cell wall hydrolase [Allosphingosinicella flava]|uniref:Cell wall hydrolase n=1 Tax=Allosphingosinicella flava TaxID=2771430 RepID=A0A7T2LLL2_9SPHN|nr:cell wall hydrolase [Sphingosinicella flava]QPQ54549.1 cell wall hydrolase [Sphingosinicella flava]